LRNADGIAELNAIRYRSLYYDTETGLYYVKKRYYDPEVGRWISPDDVGILDLTRFQVNGLNRYMFCGNDPVNNIDDNGMFFQRIGNWFSGNIIQPVVGWVDNTIIQPIVGFGTDVFNFISSDGFNTAMNIVDGIFAMTSGWLTGASGYAQHGLVRYSQFFMIVAATTSIISNATRNFRNDSLSLWEKIVATIADAGVVFMITAITFGVTAGVAMIPGVGWMIAPIAGIGTNILLTHLWNRYKGW